MREVGKKQLNCGAARRLITPSEELFPHLVGLKQHRFAGVIDDLYVRAIALGNCEERLLLLSFDMTTAPCTEDILSGISSVACVKKENILFFSIHTHAVPFNDIDMEEREAQSVETIEASKQYTDFLFQQTLDAATEAVKNMVPARMGYAWGESYVNVFRLQDYCYRGTNGDFFPVCNLGADAGRYADPSLFTMRIEDLEGKALAFFMNYSMHNVATIWNDYDGSGAMGVSSDIGGNVSKLLEEAYEGCVAVWSSGAAGDLNPQMLNEVILPDPHTGRIYEHFPKGMEYALTCLKIMTERHYADIRNTLREVRCTEECVDMRSIVEWSVTPGCDCIRHCDAPPEFLTGPDVSEHTVRLQMARVGSLTFYGVGAELYSSIGRAMLDHAPKNTVLITHNASTLCRSHYILDDETIARCDASRGFAMVPGYDEYRCISGVMEKDLVEHTISMTGKIRGYLNED